MNGWSGDADMMSDDDGDGVYTATLALLPGSYEFKFTADNWAIQENFDPATADSVCTLTTGSYTNRFITIGSSRYDS
jgi:1,4-alpha-glucan branching enzyme